MVIGEDSSRAVENVMQGQPTTNDSIQGLTRDDTELKKPKVATKERKTKTAASPKKRKSPPSHPSFLLMITEAIVSLNKSTGSSQYAITRFIEGKHKPLPPTFRKLLLSHLKKLVAAGKLVRIKNSFKLPPASASVTTSSASVSVKTSQASTSAHSNKHVASKIHASNTERTTRAKVEAKRKSADKSKTQAAVKPKTGGKAKGKASAA